MNSPQTISKENELYGKTERLDSVPSHLVGFSEVEINFIKLAAQIRAREILKTIPKLEIVK